MIGILTYCIPHRKTQDLLFRLVAKGLGPKLLVIGQDWIDRKPFTPIFKHRPDNAINVPPDELCRQLSVKYDRVVSKHLSDYISASFQVNDYLIVGGANLLPDDVVTNHKVVNTHPGFLPYTRGLDALKWAIFNQNPLGVTTHFCTPEADKGKIIDRQNLPVYFEDSFHSVALRQYELELEMLSEVPDLLKNGEAFKGNESFSCGTDAVVTRRMPHHIELIMMDRFNQIRRRSPSILTTIKKADK